jgi:spore germination cell wall hydrolase CwlJ-like protein
MLIIFCMPSSSWGNKAYTDGDVYWMTQNIYHEARGESTYGQMMICLVTLQRLYSGRWGDTIKDVVTAPGQFTWYHDNKPDIPSDKKAWKTAKTIAIVVMYLYDDNNVTERIMYYHNNTVSPCWSKKMIRVAIIGNHIFYRERI